MIDLNVDRVLGWWRFDLWDSNGRERCEKLEEKARKDKFRPEPVVIVSPMPKSYEGRYDYFLVNGNKRLRAAQMYRRALKGVVAKNINDVPEISIPLRPGSDFIVLDEILKYAICHTVQPHRKIEPNDYFLYDMDYLVKELMRYEKKETCRKNEK